MSCSRTPETLPATPLKTREGARRRQRIAAVGLPAAHEVEALVELGEQPRDLGGIVLEVAVDRDDHLAGCLGEARIERGRLAPVASEPHDADVCVVRRAGRPAPANVPSVDPSSTNTTSHSLGQRVEGRAELRVELLDAALLVTHRDDDRDHRGRGYPCGSVDDGLAHARRRRPRPRPRPRPRASVRARPGRRRGRARARGGRPRARSTCRCFRARRWTASRFASTDTPGDAARRRPGRRRQAIRVGRWRRARRWGSRPVASSPPARTPSCRSRTSMTTGRSRPGPTRRGGRQRATAVATSRQATIVGRAGTVVGAAAPRRPRRVRLCDRRAAHGARAWRSSRPARSFAQPGADARAGEIYESNGPMLAALLRSAGAEVTRLRPVADDEDAHRAALAQALEADVLVTSGGVSVGPHDLVRPTLAGARGRGGVLGRRDAPGQAARRSGHAARRSSSACRGTPSPRSSARCCSSLPALLALQGATAPGPSTERGPLAVDARPRPSRDDFVRATLESADGHVTPARHARSRT